MWNTLSQWEGTRPPPSAGDIQAEGGRLGDKERRAERGRGAQRQRASTRDTSMRIFYIFLRNVAFAKPFAPRKVAR